MHAVPAMTLASISLGLAHPVLAQPAPPTTPGPYVVPPATTAPSMGTEPRQLMVGGAVTIGGTNDRDPSYFSAGVYLEGGYLLSTMGAFDFRARGFLSAGSTVESDWSGESRRGGGGGEARACSPSRFFCAFGSADLGYQSLDLIDSDGALARAHKGLTVGWRVGVDGGGRFRFRCALEKTYQRSSGDFFDMTFVFVGLALER